MREETIKAHVESVVGPVHAPEYLKNRYRAELFAHATELFARCRGRGMDESEAAERALVELGEAEDLRAEFLRSISRVTRWSYTIETGRGGSRAKAYAPIALLLMIPGAIMVLGIEVLGWVVRGWSRPDLFMLSSVVASDYALVAYVVFAFLWLLTPFRSALVSSPPAWGRVFAIAFAHALSTLTLGVVLCLALRWGVNALDLASLDARWGLRYVAPALMAFSGTTMLLTIYYIEIRSRRQTERTLIDAEGRLPDWPYGNDSA